MDFKPKCNKMKNRNKFLIFTFITVGILIFLTSRCKKEDIVIKEDIVVKVPVLKTDSVSNITKSTAICGGDITSDGGAEVTARGLCWSEPGLPHIDDNMNMEGTGTGSFTSNLTDLTAGTLYYVRAYATNSAGTAYGGWRTFATLPDVTYGSVSDIDGNIYKTVQIGNQIWMAENLKTTHYNDGTPIPVQSSWTDSSAAYCWYKDDPIKYKETYGALYKWHAFDTAKNGGKNVCPSGWHVPSTDEWMELGDYLGGSRIASDKLQESGYSHWSCSLCTATNSTGFSALPGGTRKGDEFWGIGESGYWWSYSDDLDLYGPAWWLMPGAHIATGLRERYISMEGQKAHNEISGLCIRCIKD
jgi:uncharacterized protein (TIGR02145 family)